MDRMLRPSWGLRGMVYQGKVTYKKDPNLVAWGCPEVQTYILDENGDRIPETKPFVDPDMICWILSHRELSFACVYSGPGPNRVRTPCPIRASWTILVAGKAAASEGTKATGNGLET